MKEELYFRLHTKNYIRRCTTKGEDGYLALEAAISLTFFIFVMLAIYSIIILFMAQNMIGHALSESGQSLSLETFGSDKLEGKWSISAGLNKLLLDWNRDTDFVSNDFWFKDDYGDPQKVEAICRKRFCQYLGGDEEKADEMLTTLRVVGGLDGMDFSDTKLDGSDLTISVSYEIRLLFGIDRLKLGEFTTKQSVCSRLWGSP